MLVWRDGTECFGPANPFDGSVDADLVELFLSRRVVSRFRVEDLRGSGVRGIFHEDSDGYTCARTCLEHVATLTASAFTGRPSVTLQVVDEDL